MKKNEAIGNLFIFENMDFSELDEKYGILSSCIETDYTDGCIISTDKENSGLPVILSGRAKIVSGAGAVLRCIAEGDCFGAASIFDKSAVPNTSVYSIGNSTICTLSQKKLSEILSSEPECAMKYIEFLSEKVSFLNRKIAAFTAGSAEAKLALYLSGLCLEFDGSVILSQSHLQLSKMLDIGRASLYRAFDSLQESGIIKKDGHKITILDTNALKALIK